MLRHRARRLIWRPTTNGTINAGQPAVFTIKVTNNGTGAATDVDIDDTLPGTGLTWSVTSAQNDGVNLVAPDGCAITQRQRAPLRRRQPGGGQEHRRRRHLVGHDGGQPVRARAER